MIVSESGGSDFSKEPIPVGIYKAKCISIVGIGEQLNKFTDKMQQKVVFTWELPDHKYEWTTKEGEKKSGPSNIGKFMTTSLHEKSIMRKLLESWRGKPFSISELAAFDLDKVLGANCQIVITHKTKQDGGVKAEVGNILPYTGEPFEASKELVSYDPDNHTPESFAKLMPWLQKLITLPDGTTPYVEGGPSAALLTEDKMENVTTLEEEDVPF